MAETLLKSQQAFGGDGWQPAKETWTYASASTITVPSGAASRYQVGDRIKWTQTTVKYGVIVVVADTLLTIAVNIDYVVTNAAITANFYSHQDNPLGYPGWFNYTPTTVGWTTPASAIITARYMISGSAINFNVEINGTSNDTVATWTIPVKSVGSNGGVMGSTSDNGTGITTGSRWIATNNSNVILTSKDTYTGAWTATGNKGILCTSGFFRFSGI